MFADSLLESSWDRTRRGYTTLTSFGLQAVAIGVLLAIPLLTTVRLPSARTVSTPLSTWRRDPSPLRQTTVTRNAGTQTIPYRGQIMAPGRIPTSIPKDDGTASVDPIGPIGDREFPIGSGPSIPLPISGSRPMPPMPVKPMVRVVRTSTMLEGSIIRRVQPVYPPLARATRIQGQVVLAAVISKSGTIENLQLVTGHPMLVPSAINAVSQWLYRPYILNGEAIEVETQITVNFVLGGN